MEAFHAYSLFKNYKVLPESGGLHDQSAYFVRVLNFCDSVLGTLESIKAEKEKQAAELAKKVAGKSGKGRRGR